MMKNNESGRRLIGDIDQQSRGVGGGMRTYLEAIANNSESFGTVRPSTFANSPK